MSTTYAAAADDAWNKGAAPAKAAGKRQERFKRKRRASRQTKKAVVSLPELIRLLDGVAIEGLAEESGMTAREIVETLPENTRCFVPARRFLDVMEDISGWGEVTVLLRTADGVMEVTTQLPRGELAHGYFHWLGDPRFRGHLRFEHCSGIAFVQRAFLGRPSAFVLFFNRKGDIMFKIVIRHEPGDAAAQSQIESFLRLAARLGGGIDGSPSKI